MTDYSTHLAWDKGILIDEAIEMLAAKQNTCKTLCGTRVKLVQINNRMPDCRLCRKEIVAQAQEILDVMRDYPDRFKQDVYDYCISNVRRYGT